MASIKIYAPVQQKLVTFILDTSVSTGIKIILVNTFSHSFDIIIDSLQQYCNFYWFHCYNWTHHYSSVNIANYKSIVWCNVTALQDRKIQTALLAGNWGVKESKTWNAMKICRVRSKSPALVRKEKEAFSYSWQYLHKKS